MEILKLTRGYTIFLTGLLYLNGSVFQAGSDVWNIILPAVTFLILLQCLPVTTGITRIVGYSLFFAGTIILFCYGSGGSTWAKAIMQNGKILTLILFVPMMIIPLRFLKYRSTLESYLQKSLVGKYNKIYLFSHGISHLLGCLINIACTSITYNIFITGTGGRYKNMLTRGVVRGYTATMFWSPNSGAVGLVLAYWGHRVVDIMPYGIPLVVLSLAAGWIVNKFTQENEDDNFELKNEGEKCIAAASENEKYIRQLAAGAFLMIVSVIVIDMNTSMGILTVVPLVALIFPAVWAGLAGELEKYWDEFRNFIHDTLPAMSNEVVIFLAAGYFAVAAGITPVGDMLPLLYKNISESALLVIIVTGVIIIGLSLVGVHPVLPTTSILAAFQPWELGMSFYFLSVVILGCWSLAVTISPFSAVNLSVSSMIGKNSLEVGVKWQYRYVIVMFVIFVIYIIIVKSVFL